MLENFSPDSNVLDYYFQIIEELMLHSTLWNYTSDNTNMQGDLWNDEDLSIFCRDQQLDPDNIHSGGRALSAVIRPYLRLITGDPVTQSFNQKRREYTLIFNDKQAGNLTIFIPDFQYPRGYRVQFNNGEWTIKADEQTLHLNYHQSDNQQILRILPL